MKTFFPSLLIVALTLLMGLPSRAQVRQRRHFNHQGRPYYRGPVRLTMGGGLAFYNGDLGGVGEAFLAPAVSMGVLYRVRPRLSVGGGFSYLELGSRDHASERGLAFYGSNALGSGRLRFDLLPDESAFTWLRTGAPALQVFGQGGAGLLLYNPQTYFGTTRPTEATRYEAPERNDYPAVAAVAFGGGGLTIRLSDRLRAGLEGNYYFTTTDHLDDVSQRGNPGQKDGFFTTQLMLEYSLE